MFLSSDSAVWISRRENLDERRCVPFIRFCMDMRRRVVVITVTWCFTPSRPIRLYQGNVEERRCVPFIRFCCLDLERGVLDLEREGVFLSSDSAVWICRGERCVLLSSDSAVWI